ncbi:MAG: hypothetical protein ABI877_22675 [Gemmatimonadaceae bacterium]
MLRLIHLSVGRHVGQCPRIRALVLLAATSSIGCRDAGARIPTTTILPPAAGGEAFEPSIAIDPNNPNRLLVAAMYGVPFARGATGIWVWRSGDGGGSWADAPLDPPRMPDVDVTPTFAADVITGFGPDGSHLLVSKSDAPPLGGTFLSRFVIDSPSATSVPVYRNFVDSAAGHRVLHDKPWMIVDHGERSPYRSSIYLSVGAVTAGLGPAGVNVSWTLLGSRQLLSFSRDSGRTFSSPTLVADSSAFGGYLAVGPSGSVEIVYVRLKNRDGAGDAVFHRRSTDGGVTFEPPVTVVNMRSDTLLELPTIAARPNGDLLACWAQGDRTDEQTNQVHCAARKSGEAWSAPYGLESSLPPDVVPAWPSIVGTERGWYLMLYLVGPTRTEVALFRSSGVRVFSKIATLSVTEGLGTDRFCVVSATACRRTRTDVFAIGDYVALAASRGRLAAAYVLPRTSGLPNGGAAIYVTTLVEPLR